MSAYPRSSARIMMTFGRGAEAEAVGAFTPSMATRPAPTKFAPRAGFEAPPGLARLATPASAAQRKPMFSREVSGVVWLRALARYPSQNDGEHRNEPPRETLSASPGGLPCDP